jgi:hypothetical protein
MHCDPPRIGGQVLAAEATMRHTTEIMTMPTERAPEAAHPGGNADSLVRPGDQACYPAGLT